MLGQHRKALCAGQALVPRIWTGGLVTLVRRLGRSPLCGAWWCAWWSSDGAPLGWLLGAPWHKWPVPVLAILHQGEGVDQPVHVALLDVARKVLWSADRALTLCHTVVLQVFTGFETIPDTATYAFQSSRYYKA